jgi:hypothetical protein
LEDEVPQTPLRQSVKLLVMEDQEVPLNRRIVPESPTANTLVEELPHTPDSVLDVPLLMELHTPPSKLRMVPPSPTAMALDAELHIPRNVGQAPVVMVVQSAPS